MNESKFMTYSLYLTSIIFSVTSTQQLLFSQVDLSFISKLITSTGAIDQN